MRPDDELPDDGQDALTDDEDFDLDDDDFDDVDDDDGEDDDDAEFDMVASTDRESVGIQSADRVAIPASS